jgi:valine dehydrogenase (NAD+)
VNGPFAHLDGHEQVVYGSDPDSGLRCIIAIHSTRLGPSLGGTRFYPYGSEEDALVDVLRLSRAMSYKAACAGLDLGGGKAVIIGDPATDKSEPLLRAYGRFVDSLGGRYITACDVGTYPTDMEIVARETRWATGADTVHGGSGDSGILTAYGVFVGMKAVAERLWDQPTLAGKHVAIQGLGKVGARLAEHLIDDGAKLSVADVSTARIEDVADRLPVEVIDPADLLAVDADVLSPNALGAVLSQSTIPDLQVAAVCGGANNQLSDPLADAERLRDRGILYAPDYVVNAGGLINVSDELNPAGYNPDRCLAKAEHIGVTLREIFHLADEHGVNSEVAAERVAERRMAQVGGLRRLWRAG